MNTWNSEQSSNIETSYIKNILTAYFGKISELNLLVQRIEIKWQRFYGIIAETMFERYQYYFEL